VTESSIKFSFETSLRTKLFLYNHARLPPSANDNLTVSDVVITFKLSSISLKSPSKPSPVKAETVLIFSVLFEIFFALFKSSIDSKSVLFHTSNILSLASSETSKSNKISLTSLACASVSGCEISQM
jgi:hypothetical protein